MKTGRDESRKSSTEGMLKWWFRFLFLLEFNGLSRYLWKEKLSVRLQLPNKASMFSLLCSDATFPNNTQGVWSGQGTWPPSFCLFVFLHCHFSPPFCCYLFLTWLITHTHTSPHRGSSLDWSHAFIDGGSWQETSGCCLTDWWWNAAHVIAMKG